MVTIGNGRDDPRQWVKAAYLLIDAMESDPDGKPPRDAAFPGHVRAREPATLNPHRRPPRA
jgi:hypothetical protein